MKWIDYTKGNWQEFHFNILNGKGFIQLERYVNKQSSEPQNWRGEIVINGKITAIYIDTEDLEEAKQIMINHLINPKEQPEVIVCAACELIDTETDEIYTATGIRHYDPIMRKQIEFFDKQTNSLLLDHRQGFWTNKGRFVEREEALEIAIINNQMRRFSAGLNPNCLFSEDLY